MRSKPTIFDIESGEVFYPPGPYDGAGEETPWFMPDDAADQDEPDPLARLFAGGRRRERDLPFADPGAWARAEGLLPRALADAAAALARLAARLEYLGGAARVLSGSGGGEGVSGGGVGGGGVDLKFSVLCSRFSVLGSRFLVFGVGCVWGFQRWGIRVRVGG
jgi:hypothetical protein